MSDSDNELKKNKSGSSSRFKIKIFITELGEKYETWFERGLHKNMD